MAAPDCAICMMPLTNPASGPCNDHTFCLGCLQAALAVNRECPTCRKAALPGWMPRVSTFLRGVLESAAAVAAAAVAAAAAAPASGAGHALQQFMQIHLALQQQQTETVLKAQLAAQETMRQALVRLSRERG